MKKLFIALLFTGVAMAYGQCKISGPLDVMQGKTLNYEVAHAAADAGSSFIWGVSDNKLGKIMTPGNQDKIELQFDQPGKLVLNVGYLKNKYRPSCEVIINIAADPNIPQEPVVLKECGIMETLISPEKAPKQRVRFSASPVSEEKVDYHWSILHKSGFTETSTEQSPTFFVDPKDPIASASVDISRDTCIKSLTFSVSRDGYWYPYFKEAEENKALESQE